nr:protein phosphatase 2C domain-containing protein [Saccharibacillus sp. JS10]
MPSIEKVSQLTVGRYGGNTQSGAYKNEDGFLIWCDPTWEFVTLIDAHHSCDSAELIIATLQQHEEAIRFILDSDIKVLFDKIEHFLLSLLKSDSFLEQCRSLQGEASCLITIRKDNMLGWLSVGDCELFLIHEELEKWNQTRLNQRNFYEWIGKVNSFDQVVPSYSLGRRQLRTGTNHICMITDGYLDHTDAAISIADLCRSEDLGQAFLEELHQGQTVDSTTFVSFRTHNEREAAMPSDSPQT